MKKIIYLIIFLTLVVVLIVILSLSNDRFNSFLKGLKYGENYNLGIKDNKNGHNIKEEKTQKENDLYSIKYNDKNNYKELNNLKKTQKENVLNIQKKFEKFALEEKAYKKDYKIFGITNYYRKEYLRFFNNKFEIYFFYNASYKDLEKLFSLLSYEQKKQMPFSIDESNKFGKKSFFINVNKKDNYKRIIIDDGKIVFGIKIKKKTYYESIKNILLKI